MAATLPLQEPGPGPTAQALPSWLSYSAVTTLTSPFLSTVTRIVYYPDGSLPPTPTLVVNEGTQTSVQYSVIYRPLLYDGPFPAPPLGTLFTTQGQVVAVPSQSEGGQQPGSLPQPTAAPGDNGNRAQGGQQPDQAGGGNNSSGNGNGSSDNAAQGGNGQAETGGQGTDASGAQGPGQGNNDDGGTFVGGFGPSATGTQGTFFPTAPATSAIGGDALPTPTDAADSSSLAASLSAVSLASSISASLASESGASASSVFATTTSPSTSTSGSAQPSNTGVVGVNSFDDGLSSGQIIGIVIGALLALLLLLLALLCCWHRRRKRREEEDRAAGLTGGHMGGPGHQRRQLSDRWASGFSRGGAQGTYAAIGTAGAAGAGATAAAGRDRENSDEWEEDQLRSGGSGFFVVGGRDGATSDSIPTVASTVQRNRGAKRSALEALGLGAAGGLVAAAIGRRRSGNRGASQLVPTDEADIVSDDDEGTGEKRGLMDFDDEGAPEMSEGGNRQSWLAGTAAAAAGAGVYAATRPSNEDPFDEKAAHAAQQDPHDEGQDLGSPSATRRTMTPSTSASSSAPGWASTAAVAGLAGAVDAGGASAASHRRNSDSFGGGYTTSGTGGYTSGSQSGAASRSGSGSGSRGGHASSRGGGTSTNSTGARTVQSSPTTQSLPPPPRAPRDRQGVTTYGNVAPAAAGGLGTLGATVGASNASGKPRIPSFTGGFGEGQLDIDPSRPSIDSAPGSSNDHAGLYLGVAAAGAGLGALAAGHRESGGSSYSRGAYPAGEEDAQRHSRFLSQNTPLLGPGAANGGAREQQQQQQHHLAPYSAGPSTAYGHGRLPTIRSVGEFGEAGSGVHSLNSNASGNSSGGYARGSLLSPTSEEQQAQTPTSGGGAQALGGAGTFYTPPGSPRGTLGQARSMRSIESGPPSRLGGTTGLAQGTDEEDANNPFVDRSTSAHEYTDNVDEASASGHGHLPTAAAGGLAAGGLLGGLAAGWRRLTMGGDGTPDTAERDVGSPPPPTTEAASGDFSPRSHAARRDPAQASDPGLAADVQSMRASVHQSSTLGHAGGQSSPATASGEHSRATSGDLSLNLTSSAEEAAPSSGDSGDRLVIAGAGVVALGTAAHNSGASFRSSQPSTGYSASISGVSNNTSSRSRSGPEGSRRSVLSASTGLDSLSQRAHVSEHSSVSASGTRSSASRHTAASESGASTGAASYSPSVLRNSTSSTRGGGSAGRRVPVPVYEETLEEGYESEGQSSRATAGGSSSLGGGRKRPRSGSLDGAVGADASRQQLDSLREVQEGPVEDLYGHYPSASLGAAAMRQAYREAELQRAAAGVSHSPQSSTSQTRMPRSLPRSLVAGSGAPVPPPHALSTSASSPSLREPSGASAASSSWRESPRVASASMRAAEAAAYLEASRAQAPQAAWGDLETTSPVARPSGLRSEEGAQAGATAEQQQEEARTSQWPKFLRF